MAQIIGYGPGGGYYAVPIRGTRQVNVGLKYMAVDATKIFDSAMSSFSYTDEAHSNSDRISMQCDNIDGRWGNNWYPDPYDRIEPKLIYSPDNWPDMEYPCGVFYVDSVDLTWPSRVIDFDAVSKPIVQDFTITEKSKIWQAVTLQKIGQEMTGNAGLAFVFDAADTAIIESVEQSKQTDMDFLKKLCDDYGKKLKVYADKVIIYDLAAYEAKPSVLTVNGDICTDCHFTSTAQGSYTGARLAYTDSKKNTTIDVSVGTPERLLTLNQSVKTEAEALEKARNALNDENRKAATVTFGLTVPRFIAASSVVTLELFGGRVDGRYFVTKVTYSISGGTFSESIEAYKIPELIQ